MDFALPHRLSSLLQKFWVEKAEAGETDIILWMS
jgi:hypothetical protein